MSENDAPSPTISQRAKIIKKVIKKIYNLNTEKNVRIALNTRNGPSTSDFTNLLLNTEILVWREPGAWKELYKLVVKNGEQEIIDLEK